MMRTQIRALLVAALLGAPAASLAADDTHTGFRQVMAGDTNVEAMLTRQHRLFPEDPSFTLNLAAIYARTDRADAARALYRDVLARPDEELDMANDRTQSAHSVAKMGMKRLGTPLASAR